MSVSTGENQNHSRSPVPHLLPKERIVRIPNSGSGRFPKNQLAKQQYRNVFHTPMHFNHFSNQLLINSINSTHRVLKISSDLHHHQEKSKGRPQDSADARSRQRPLIFRPPFPVRLPFTRPQAVSGTQMWHACSSLTPYSTVKKETEAPRNEWPSCSSRQG